MGRWDNKPTEGYDKFNPRDDLPERDEWQEANNTDFNWREIHPNDHPRGCTCPKHEWAKERARSKHMFPITYRYCPDHYQLYLDTQEEMWSKLKWYQKIIIRFLKWRKLIRVVKLTAMESDLCFMCKYGTGGRGGGGIKRPPPLTPDMP